MMGPPTPAATRDGARPLDFELSGMAAMPTVSGPTYGPDMAVAFGLYHLHLRVGMVVLGGPDRTASLAGHRIGEVLDAGTMHLCAARGRPGVRIRLCGGGQFGVTHLRYRGFENPGRRAMPWGAVTAFSDLSISLGRHWGLEPDRLGVMINGGAMLPVLGPAVVMRADGFETTVRRPNSFGATFGAGLRVGLR
ncbi:MAG: hypothetical protein AAF799_09935 [Myxococcota bacterium]